VFGRAGRRFHFIIDPKAPLKELLPVPPKGDERPVAPLVEDLARVPEIALQQPPPRNLPPEKAEEQTALTIARINHLNKEKSDRFVEALLQTRADLAGIPVAMGEACRTTEERGREFKYAALVVRQALQISLEAQASARAATPNSFWDTYLPACASEDRTCGRKDVVTCARIAALMQVLAPESPALRLGLVKYLANISHVEASRALVRLAIFSPEDEVRAAAIDALKMRSERDYSAILLQGLRYPLPAVARHASAAVVKLQRTDLIPQLLSLLDEADPRAPVFKAIDNTHVPVVREVVRINHERNCLLCHSPGNTRGVSLHTLTAAVPVPGQSLPKPSQSSYGSSDSGTDILVRADVTYLRQDFSVRLPVADANPGPERQRFDFLVRTRVVTDQEAKVVAEILGKRAPGMQSPYHQAVLTALRELTGRDTEPRPQAWRRLLGLPTTEARVITARR
jgi:hypothetical protein